MNLLKQKNYLFIFSLILFFSLTGTADAATLYTRPSLTKVSVGNIVSIQVLVNTGGEVINNAETTVQYPPDLLEIISLDKTSIFSLWVQEPSYSNYTGQISLNGGVPNPGFQGTGGKILSITFRAKKTGTASVVFLDSAVRANDGLGTDILTSKTGSEITIGNAIPETPSPSAPAASTAATNIDLLANITSVSHPDQTVWYALSRVVLDWTNAQGVSTVRLGYDTNADGVPSVLYDEPISHKELQLNDGIWYFHVREKGTSGWGPISTFRIQIDTEPPVPVVLEFPNGATTATSTIAVSFATKDKLSGIDHYRVAVDGNSFELSAAEGSGIYALPSGDPGTHTLNVTAYDKAGNYVSAEQQFTSVGTPARATPAWSYIAWLIANYLVLIIFLLIALAVILILGWYLWHRFYAFRRRVVNKEERMHALVHRRFSALKDAISDEISALEDIKSRRKLTIEEERLINRLQKLIDESEADIEKEIDSMLKK